VIPFCEEYNDGFAGYYVLPRRSVRNRFGFVKTTITYPSLKIGLPDKPNVVRLFLAWSIFGLRWEDAARKEAQP
jgi:hypothetical protein